MNNKLFVLAIVMLVGAFFAAANPSIVEKYLDGSYDNAGESVNAVTDIKSAQNASLADKTKVASHLDDGNNMSSVSELFFGYEDRNYTYIGGIVSGIKRDGFGLMEIVTFSSGYSLTTINAMDFPNYPGSPHIYKLVKMDVNGSIYYTVHSVRIVSDDRFAEFRRERMANKSGSMDAIVSSPSEFKDGNVSIAMNDTVVLVKGKFQEIRQSQRIVGDTIRLQGGLNIPALNGRTYNYTGMNNTTIFIEEEKVVSGNFSFFKIKNIYSMEGS